VSILGEAPPSSVSDLDELVGADRVAAGRLDDAADYVVRLLRDPGDEIRVAGGQLELGDDLVVPGHPDGFELASIEPRDPGCVWAIDGGSCVVADGRAFQVAAFRAARVRFDRGATELVESPALEVRAVAGAALIAAARETLTELLGDEPEAIPELPRPVDAFREWAEWRMVLATIDDASEGDLVLVDGSLHGGPLVPPAVVRRAHDRARERGVSLAGVVKASTLFWGRHAPLVTLLKRRGDREVGPTRWATRISTDPVFGRLYIGDIFVAHLAPTAPHAFRVDVAHGPSPADPAPGIAQTDAEHGGARTDVEHGRAHTDEVLGRLAGLSSDPAFVGYPYPLARAHQAARVTGHAVADVRRAFRDALGRHGLSDDDVEVLFQDFHEVLNRS
jgi:hypothetical protein